MKRPFQSMLMVMTSSMTSKGGLIVIPTFRLHNAKYVSSWLKHIPEGEDCKSSIGVNTKIHEDVIKWKYFPLHWTFVRGFQRSPVNSTHEGQWRSLFSLICAWINGWIDNREAGDLRSHGAHYDVTVMHAVTVLEISLIMHDLTYNDSYIDV